MKAAKRDQGESGGKPDEGGGHGGDGGGGIGLMSMINDQAQFEISAHSAHSSEAEARSLKLAEVWSTPLSSFAPGNQVCSLD